MLTASLRTTLLTSALLIASTTPAFARRPFVNLIPNGALSECANCHVNPGGGGPRNAFGRDVGARLVEDEANWSAELAGLDSDGDGHTNGEELGDPAGTWRPGAANPDAALISLPGSAQSTLCGDDIINGMEACDGDDLTGATCPNAGETPRCASDCTVTCVPPMPPDTDMPADMTDMPVETDMPVNTDMPADMPSTVDMPGPGDGGPIPDMGPGTSNPPPANNTDDDDDGGCAQAGATPRAPSLALAMLSMLGLVRRRKRA